MSFGSRVISMFNRAAPKLSRTIGQVADVGRNIGQIVKHGRNIGSIANQFAAGYGIATSLSPGGTPGNPELF
jgi:hypothetical protein